MNQRFDYIPAFDDAAQEREWQAQENALQRERLNFDPAGDDERGRRYRQLAKTLNIPLPETLPADFASRVAARAAATSTARFEYVLVIALMTALVVVAGIVIATYGNEWTSPRNAPSNAWLMALAGCLGASWLMERWQRHGRH